MFDSAVQTIRLEPTTEPTRASAKWVRADKDKRIVPPTKLRALDNERIRWTVDNGRVDTRDESHLKGMPSTESAAPHRPRGNTDREILTRIGRENGLLGPS